jgi:hypothetical protein
VVEAAQAQLFSKTATSTTTVNRWSRQSTSRRLRVEVVHLDQRRLGTCRAFWARALRPTEVNLPEAAEVEVAQAQAAVVAAEAVLRLAEENGCRIGRNHWHLRRVYPERTFHPPNRGDNLARSMRCRFTLHRLHVSWPRLRAQAAPTLTISTTSHRRKELRRVEVLYNAGVHVGRARHRAASILTMLLRSFSLCCEKMQKGRNVFNGRVSGGRGV